MRVTIARESPGSADAIELIDELERYFATLYPRESQYGLSPQELTRQDVAFFLARLEGETVGCGGVKICGEGYGEVKRMYVRPGHRGKGLGKLMLRHLEAHALAQGITVLRLETGICQPEAIGLYERMGYYPIPPFGEYRKGRFNLFYEKRFE